MVSKWDLAGYGDPDGRIGKTVPPGQVMIPGRITLKKQVLNWSLRPSVDCLPKFVTPSQRLLDDFVKLWQLPEQEILAFAKQNGVLGLYIVDQRSAEIIYPDLFQPLGKRKSAVLHSITAGPDQVCRSRLMTFEKTGREAEGQLPDSIDTGTVVGLIDGGVIVNMFMGREPIRQWRRESRKASALLNIGADLALRKRIDPDEWKCLGPYADKGYLDRIQHADHSARVGALVWHLNRVVAGVSFSIGWNPTRARSEVQLNYHGSLLNAVGLQLALTISKADSLYTCSGCGKLYPRCLRRPKRGQGNFCDECEGAGVALRQADERRRAKMAEARRLHASKVSVNEIAKRLDTTPASIRRWVKKG